MAERPAKRAIEAVSAEPRLAALLAAVQERFGACVDAVLLYGSYLRGNTSAMPDLYVVLSEFPVAPRLERWLGGLLPPNVYVMRGGEVRAKVSVLRTRQLLNAVTLDVHPYFWARFAQPCRLLYCRNAELQARLQYIAATSARRLLDAMRSPQELNTPAAYWSGLLQRTYAAELRSERPIKFEEIYETNAAYYDALYERRPAGPGRPLCWLIRQSIGKLLSAARLLKSVATFEDPVGYMLWKVERHSGVRLEATERQRRYPFLFAWPLVWRLYRSGAFK